MISLRFQSNTESLNAYAGFFTFPWINVLTISSFGYLEVCIEALFILTITLIYIEVVGIKTFNIGDVEVETEKGQSSKERLCSLTKLKFSSFLCS